jgi:hypothetical protein
VRSDRAVAHGRERALDRVRGPQMFPVLCREVVERREDVAILGQAIDGLLAIRAVGVHEHVECDERVLLGLGHPDLLKGAPSFRVKAIKDP